MSKKWIFSTTFPLHYRSGFLIILMKMKLTKIFSLFFSLFFS